MGIRAWEDEISAQKQRLFAWVPVAFGAGIAAYFGLKFEPALWTGMVAVALCLPAAFYVWRRHHDSLPWFFAYLVAGALLCASLGFLAAQVGTRVHGTPILEKGTGTVNISGIVQSIEDMGGKDGSRVVLSDVTIEDVSPENTPRKIRLRFRKDEGLKAGERIATLGQIDPPSGPVLPGSYDFRRHLFFEGIGGVGFSYRAATVLEEKPPEFFEGLRNHINSRIKAQAGSVTSGIMTALITGERAAIAEEDDDAMRDSGLYHLLSISGTHVTLVAGVLFFFSRLIMAAFPWAALHWPIKKIAAIIALAGAAFYVSLAGAEVPAQRALLMTALIMIAIMLDRSPFSLRLIAFAALVVLAFAPFALVGVSFQMSFAAVAALICFFEWIRPWWMKWYSRGGFIRKSFMYLIGILLTSVIAGGMTGLFSLYHFQSFAMYGVLSNMMAVPLTGIVIMPAAVLAMVLMPFGIEGFALQIMEWGTLWMLAIAHWAGGLDGAVVHVKQWPAITFALICVGMILFLLWEGGRGKGVALALVIVGLTVAPFAAFPDVMAAGNGGLVGVRQGEGLFVSSRSVNKFSAENWVRLMGREGQKTIGFQDKKSPARCDSDGCRVEIKGRKIAMLPNNPRAWAEDCAWADVVIGYTPLKKRGCDAPVIIDRYDLMEGGAHAVYLDGLRVRSVGAESGDRPWGLIKQ